jgi:hexosaminidase
MNPSITLLPNPKHLDYLSGELNLDNHCIILIASLQVENILFSAKRFQSELKRRLGFDWELSASSAVPADQIGLILEIDPDVEGGLQGYQLKIQADGIHIRSQGQPGIFYGVCTLIQILDQCGRKLPYLVIEDEPDFPARGVMLDISRDKVPSMQTLFELIDRLASWKINQIQLYTEHTFAYRNHPDVWQEASPITSQEVLELDVYCQQRYIELVPNQNSFGHLTRWLKHPRYAVLAETHEEFETPWGKERGPFSLAPANPGSLMLIKSLYDELLPNFSSSMVNVGCDETFDVGTGQSREMCAVRGTDRVMFDFLQSIYQDITSRGLTVQFWADILVHHPHLLAEMPKDAIALLWFYEASQSFEEQSALFESAGMPFYVCPGTSAWNSLGGRAQNAIENNLDAAKSGLAHHAQGYLNTDWGDNGHWQMAPVSLLGFMIGAAYSWCVETNQNVPVDDCLSRFGFEDKSGFSGKAMIQLGNVYRETGMEIPNSSALFWILQYPLDVLKNLGQVSPERLDACLAQIDQAQKDFSRATIKRHDRKLLKREFELIVRMMRHACLRGQLLNEKDSASRSDLIHKLKVDIEEWIEEYRSIWLERNRPGGLKDSAGRFDRLLGEYRSLEN